MQATLTDKRFSDADWIYERKFDGERALAFRDGDTVRLLTRNQKDIGKTYPELIDALSAQACENFVVDGEIVAFEGARTSFARLQRRMQIKDPDKARARGVAVYYYLFDLLDLDGCDLARGLTAHLASRHASLLTIEQRKSKRGDRDFLDYLRNA
jgi:bifunctional non-homologous end joining protein LigD